MEKDFEDFIVARCQSALTSSNDYLALEHGKADQEEIQDMAQIICYKQGFMDAIKIFKM